jgi:hypothetical protein
MEDDLNFWGNGRRPQFIQKWKTTSTFGEMEDSLSFVKWKTTSTFGEMEDSLSFEKWKTTSIF